MKTTKASIIDMVNQLSEMRETKKAIEKSEQILKTALKDFMGNNSSLEVGNYVVLIEARSREDLDKKALLIELGSETLAKFTKKSVYEILTIKPITRAGV